jgi:hypothetical protein
MKVHEQQTGLLMMKRAYFCCCNGLTLIMAKFYYPSRMTSTGEGSFNPILQIRRPKETEVTLAKHWKNMKGRGSKFKKPFAYPKFAPPRTPLGASRKHQATAERRVAAQTLYDENKVASEKIFNHCIELIASLQEIEVLVKSGELEDTTEIITKAKSARENIRANRLLRYEEMAKKDEEFQKTTLDCINLLTSSIAGNQQSIHEFIALLERYVVVKELGAAPKY